MSNEKQIALAVHLYAMDHDDHIPPFAHYPGASSAGYTISSHYTVTLKPYYQDVEVWQDPSRVPYEDGTGQFLPDLWDLPSMSVTGYIVGGHYTVVWGQFMFADSRLSGHGVQWTKVHDDIQHPSRTNMFWCTDFGMSGQPGLWGGYYDGRHNGTENFAFADGHAAPYQTKKVVDWWRGSNQYSYTYPVTTRPVHPGKALWWTVPWYPDPHPYSYPSRLP